MATNTDEREEIKPVAPTEQTKWRDPSLVGKYMVDPKTGLAGLFRSPDNGETWVLTDTVYGHVYNQDEVDNIWDNGAGHKVADEIKSATADLPNVRKQADEAVKFAESAIAASKVNSDAIVAQSSAVVEAKSAMDSATAEIQQLKANAASDVAQIRADVAQVQNEVDAAKAANSASVDKLKSDIGLAQKDLDNVRDSLTKAQSAVEQNKKLINDSVAKINSDIAKDRKDMDDTRTQLSNVQDAIAKNRQDLESNVAKINNDIAQDRKDITEAQQANTDTAKKLDSYTKQATEQGKTIKDLQANDDSMKLTIADVKGNVSQVQDSVTGLTASLKDANDNLATVKVLADSLSATLTDHGKNIASLQATAKELSSTLGDADGRLSKVEQTAEEQSTTLSTVQGNLSQVKQTVDGLTDTLKDAQGDIAKVQATAKGLSEQITNAQGAITDLQTDVTGVKATIADHDKNIHTLQADNKTLKDDMTDAKGNISSLQKTSTSLTSEMQDHSGRLSKVEQTATEHTSTLSDLQGNLSQVKQTADGLVTTLKDAQGNIDQIKQDAKGTLEQLSNVQGDITALQTDVSGIKLTIADHEKNIHTLQADSKTLKDDMADAKGNISSLQKTSTSLVSEFRDHDGRLSKVEQTATEHTSELADTKGNLDKVTQKADNLQLLLSDAQKNIQNIQLDAKGLHDTLTGQSNQLASLNVTLNNLDSKYSGITGDLQSKQTALSTEQQQTKDMLLRKADKSEVDNVKGTVNQVSAEQKTMADQINQKVSSAEYQTLKDKVNGMHVGGRNLLKGTRDFNSKYWYQSGDHTALADNPADSSTKEIHSWQDWHSFKNNQTIQLDPSKDYMISADIAIYGGDGSGLYVTPYGTIDGQGANLVSTNINLAGFPKQANGEGFRRIYLPMTKHGHTLNDFRIEGHGNWNAGSGSVFISKIALYEGNTKQGWEDSSDDLIENIQKNTTAIDENSKLISLMAKQTEVDNVKNTAQQISSRLDILAGEVKSKVDETRVNNIVDGKGYATTSTVQSLVDQKAGTLNESIVKLDQTVKTGAENNVQLIRKSDFEDGDKGTWAVSGVVAATNPAPPSELGQSGMKVLQTNTRDGYEEGIWYSVKPGEKFDVDFWCAPSSAFHSSLGLVFADKDKANWNWRGVQTDQSGQWKHYTGTIMAPVNAMFAKPWYQMDKPASNTANSSWLAKPSIRRQNATTVNAIQSLTASIDGLQSRVTNYQNDTSSKYTQLSNLMQSKVGTADFDNLKRSVDMQTLDSADINNMKTNGHYFVHNLNNSPIAGWVYVDVTGNGNDRIRQDVYQDGGNQHKYRRWFGTYWTGWDEGATYTEITQLQDALNLRVQKGELLSQINLTAGNTLIQSNKLYLDASSVVFSGRAFIPSAAIAEIDADKLTFYGNGTKATIGAGIAEYDQDKFKSTINMQYSGGFEIHASNELGSILTMHDNTVRLASKSQTYSSGSGKPLDQQYSGFWASSNYALINAVDSEGKTTGWSIGPSNSNGYRAYLYDSSTSVQPNFGVGIGTQRFDVYAGGAGLYLGPDKAELRDKSYTTIHSDTEAFIEGGNEQIYIHDGEVCIGMPGHESDKTSVHLRVFGWADFNGWMNVMGLSQTSLLSTKTRIEPLDTRDALDKIMAANVETYQFKSDVAEGKTKRHASVIIDDVHDVSQYYTPEEFISENRKGRDDGDIVGYLMGAVQELKKQLDKVKEKINYE